MAIICYSIISWTIISLRIQIIMASLSFYVALVIFFSIKVTFQQTTFHSGAKNVKIANLFRIRRYRLAILPLVSFELPDELKCLTTCVKSNECYCVNTRKLENENVMCELLNRTMYQYPEKLTKSEGSSHWYTKVRYCLTASTFKNLSLTSKMLCNS